MILKIGNRTFEEYNGVSVSLRYDSVASTFSFDVLFEPERSDHREVFQPATYKSVTIEHEGELLITGQLLSHSFRSSSITELTSVAGYSKTGVLEDCEIPTSVYPLQSNKLTLRQIANKILKPFKLDLVVDPIVQSVVDKVYPVSTASDSQSCKQYLAELAGQRHVMLTHNERGGLVMTQAQVSAPPIHDFYVKDQWLSMELGFDGQAMHSEITMIKQQTKGRKDGTHKKGNAGQAAIKNPYVPSSQFRPRTVRQTSGEMVDTKNAVRNMLSEEIATIPLKIEIKGWKLNGRIVRPNTVVTVTNPDLYLYNKTRWFVAQVDFHGDQNAETALLTCFPLAAFSSGTPLNIFA